MPRRSGAGPGARGEGATVGLTRLKRRPEFLAVAAARRRWATPGLVLQARRREPSDTIDRSAMRYGITASRKVGNAVARNRAKRRLRAVVSEILPVAGMAGYDVVLIARAATIDRPFADLKTDLAQALAKVMAGRRGTKPTELNP